MVKTIKKTKKNPSSGAVVSKAVLSAARRLGMSNAVLSKVIGVSPSQLSRLAAQSYVLEPDSKEFELSILFIRLFRSLDAIVGGDEKSAAEWMQNKNLIIGHAPVDHITKISGLFDVLSYLDSRRAII